MRFWLKKQKRKMATAGFFILSAIILLSTGCWDSGGSSGSSASEESATATDTVTITGDFENRNYADNNWFNRFLPAFLPSAHAFDPNRVAKVLAFYGNGKFEITEVTEEGGFSMNVAKGAPIGLIFAGEDDSYQGYLTLGEGMDSLPLHYDEENIATIDLETLSEKDTNTVSASADILGQKFRFSKEEQNALGYADNLFASIVKNPDVNDNGSIDLLEKKFFRLYIFYYFYGGDFGGNLTPAVNPESEIWNGFKFGILTAGGGMNWPQEVWFTGPTGSAFESSEPSENSRVYDKHAFYYSEYVGNIDYPKAGQYSVDYTLDSGPETLKFTVPDQSEASANIVLPIPTVELNNDNTINKITWVYKAAKEGFEIRPQALIKNIELQISDGQQQIYNTDNLPAESREHVLENQMLLWQNIHGITLAYDDVYGNHNVVSWMNK